MFKICGKSVYRPLKLIFNEYILNGVFPSEWKNRNIVPIYKKNNRQCLENYNPVLLPLICGKILKCVVFNEMLWFFIKNGLILQNQSGFKPGHSHVNQILSITHKMYILFNNGFDLNGVFLDMSKAFNKVWNVGIIFKLKMVWYIWQAFKLMLFFKEQKIENSFKHTSFKND